MLQPGVVVSSVLLKIGGGSAKVQDLRVPTVSQAYKLTWERECLDLTELARLRWIEKWKIKKFAEHFEISTVAVEERLRTIKTDPRRISIEILQKIRRSQ